MSLKSIVRKLAGRAEFNKNKAYAFLGAEPGPGIDIMITPVEPLCGKWNVEGLTKAGLSFVKNFWQHQPLSNQKVAELRKQATDWGLTFKTKVTWVPIEPSPFKMME